MRTSHLIIAFAAPPEVPRTDTCYWHYSTHIWSLFGKWVSFFWVHWILIRGIKGADYKCMPHFEDFYLWKMLKPMRQLLCFSQLGSTLSQVHEKLESCMMFYSLLKTTLRKISIIILSKFVIKHPGGLDHSKWSELPIRTTEALLKQKWHIYS